MAQLIRAEGAIYAVAPGVFHHVPDPATLARRQALGLYSKTIKDTSRAGAADYRRHALVGNTDVLPAKPAVAKPPTAVRKTHKVASGETLGAIATKYGTTPEQIKAWNPDKIKNVDVIEPGWVLFVGK